MDSAQRRCQSSTHICEKPDGGMHLRRQSRHLSGHAQQGGGQTVQGATATNVHQEHPAMNPRSHTVADGQVPQNTQWIDADGRWVPSSAAGSTAFSSIQHQPHTDTSAPAVMLRTTSQPALQLTRAAQAAADAWQQRWLPMVHENYKNKRDFPAPWEETSWATSRRARANDSIT